MRLSAHRRLLSLAVAIPLLLILAGLVYQLPPVHSRLAWRVSEVRTRLKYALHPPEQAIFIPQGQADASALATPVVHVTSLATLPNATATLQGPTATPAPSPTATITPTSLPGRVFLEGVRYEHQHNRLNYCGPANLSMALTFWGWKGNRDVVGKEIKPDYRDKNVMPYEMVDFVGAHAEGLSALTRAGGDLDLLKHLVANGFPVVAEKGYYDFDYTGKMGWLGHYQFITGYDDPKGVLTVQDTYVQDGENYEIPYETFLEGWRSFNYVFVLVYPSDRNQEVYRLLGPWADASWANQRALEVAISETNTLSGINRFFAWFNLGSSQVGLQQYADAARSYDHAFHLYASLPEDGLRPYRMLWYQTGPYWAYYYTGRYQDVINLADTTLYETISEPVLEESFYWRALAKAALGDTKGATEDLRTSVKLNPNFQAGKMQLQQFGSQE
jgi:hypothetical protein